MGSPTGPIVARLFSSLPTPLNDISSFVDWTNPEPIMQIPTVIIPAHAPVALPAVKFAIAGNWIFERTSLSLVTRKMNSVSANTPMSTMPQM